MLCIENSESSLSLESTALSLFGKFVRRLKRPQMLQPRAVTMESIAWLALSQSTVKIGNEYFKRVAHTKNCGFIREPFKRVF